jgi:hypothetical protein
VKPDFGVDEDKIGSFLRGRTIEISPYHSKLTVTVRDIILSNLESEIPVV